jgi:hypothetical protein
MYECVRAMKAVTATMGGIVTGAVAQPLGLGYGHIR